MKYAKILSETAVTFNAPKSATIDGKLIIGTLPSDYLESIGYYPYEETAAPTPPDGYHIEARYELVNKKVMKQWIVVENPPVVEPPHVYSKLKILLAAQRSGMDTAFIDLLESNITLKYIWDASNTIDDNELLNQYLPTIGQAIGKTPDEIKAFLDENCVAN